MIGSGASYLCPSSGQGNSVLLQLNIIWIFRLFSLLGYYKTPKCSFIQGKEYIKMDTPFSPFSTVSMVTKEKAHTGVCVYVCLCG